MQSDSGRSSGSGRQDGSINSGAKEPPSYLSNRISDILNDLGNESLD